MGRFFFTLSIPLLIFILVLGMSQTKVTGELKKVSLAVEGMV